MADDEHHDDHVEDNDDDLDPNDPREEIHVSNGKFQRDSHKISAFITSQIKVSVCDEGHCWRMVTTAQRQWYWDQFVAQYKWRRRNHAIIEATWQHHVATLYRKTVHAWRDADRKPKCLAVDVWAAWKAVWASEPWQRRAAIYKGNRHSEPAGPGTGMTKHTAGSRSFVDHNNAMRAEFGREPNSYELFYKTHTNRSGEFVDERSRATNAAYQSQRELLAAMSGAGSSEAQNISDTEINQLYLSVVGGVQKGGKVYGLGTQASGIYPEVNSYRGASSSGGRRSIAEMSEGFRRAEENVRRAEESTRRAEEKAQRAEEKSQRAEEKSKMVEAENDKLRDRMGSLEKTVRDLVAGLRCGNNKSSSASASRRHQLQRRPSSSKFHDLSEKFTHVSGTYGDDEENDDTDDYLFFDKDDAYDDDETQAP